MIYMSSKSFFIKVLTTSKMFLVWLNINLELLKIDCNQTKYVRVGEKHLLTNGMAWCPVSHTSAAQ